MNDVWILRVMGSSRDLNVGISLQWEHIIFKGVPPTPRFDHRACEVNGKMYILGGMNYVDEANTQGREVFEAESYVHVLDTSIWEWVTPKCSFMGLQEEQLISNSYCTLHTDLLKLLCDAQHGTATESDMAFHCNNDGNDEDNDGDVDIKKCTFRAHSVLLKARSSFLKMMLEANMKEASSKQVTIYRSEPSVFFSLLIYLYTDTLRINPEDSTLLLEFANQYQITRLQTLIEGFLCQQANFTNLLDLLELSEIFALEQLKLTCFSLILQNENCNSSTMNEIRQALCNDNNNDNNNNNNNQQNENYEYINNFDNTNTNERGLSSSLISEFDDYRKNVRHIYMIDVKDNVHRSVDIDDSKVVR